MELKSDITELKKAIPIVECRKILGDYDSTDDEIGKLRDNLEILVNSIFNEVFNGKRKSSDLLSGIKQEARERR